MTETHLCHDESVTMIHFLIEACWFLMFLISFCIAWFMTSRNDEFIRKMEQMKNLKSLLDQNAAVINEQANTIATLRVGLNQSRLTVKMMELHAYQLQTHANGTFFEDAYVNPSFWAFDEQASDSN